MAKIQLTLSTGYVSSWGAWEGVREVVQNGLDALDDGFALDIRHSGKDVLRVSSEGVKLDSNVWLLGTTSKESGNYRGHFGEGLKLGVLALVRAGHDVKIVNDDESWTPKIEESETFGGADVLTIYTHKRQIPAGRFTVEIGGITKETWAMLKPRFLHLVQPKNAVTTSRGEVILDKTFKGKVFVKGIFVQHKADLAAGYNFHHVDTDRDRKMVADWDLKYNAAMAWQEAMTQTGATPKLVKRVIAMLNRGDTDVQQMGDSYGGVNKAIAAKVAEHFKAEHGESAIPVTSMAESREVEHLGKRGIVVPRSLAKVLEEEIGSVDSARQMFKLSVAKTYGWDDLSPEEQGVYSRVIALVEPASTALGHMPVEARLTVVDFNDPIVMGLHRHDEGGVIEIARKLLTSFEETLSTVVHEVAHDKGIDGAVGHERAIERLFSRIVSNLANAH